MHSSIARLRANGIPRRGSRTWRIGCGEPAAALVMMSAHLDGDSFSTTTISHVRPGGSSSRTSDARHRLSIRGRWAVQTAIATCDKVASHSWATVPPQWSTPYVSSRMVSRETQVGRENARSTLDRGGDKSRFTAFYSNAKECIMSTCLRVLSTSTRGSVNVHVPPLAKRAGVRP